MGPLAAALLPFLPGLIHGAESAYRAMQKAGPFKMQTVVRALGQIAEAMLTAQLPLSDGTQIKAGTVSDDFLKGLAESEFQRMQATGALANAPVTNMYWLRGTVVPIPA